MILVTTRSISWSRQEQTHVVHTDALPFNMDVAAEYEEGEMYLPVQKVIQVHVCQGFV